MAPKTTRSSFSSLVVKAPSTRIKRSNGANRIACRYECDCCGTLVVSINDFDDHLTWQCGRKFGCRVFREDAPMKGISGIWHAENVQTGLKYQGNILPNDNSHLTDLSQSALDAKVQRRVDLTSGALCAARKASKPRMDQMSYRLNQEKARGSNVGHWFDRKEDMVRMVFNDQTKRDEVAPGQHHVSETCNVDERQILTWKAQKLDGRLRREPNTRDIFVVNMTVLNKLLASEHQQQELEEEHEDDLEASETDPPEHMELDDMAEEELQDLNEQEPEDEDDDNTEKMPGISDKGSMECIQIQQNVDKGTRSEAPDVFSRDDTPPPYERPYSCYWDSVSTKQGKVPSDRLHAMLLQRQIIFSDFKYADDFFEIGSKVLKMVDGSMKQAAMLLEDFFNILDAGKEWSSGSWEQFRHMRGY